MASCPDGAVQVRINAMKSASTFRASEDCSQYMSNNARRLLELEKSLAVRFRGKRQEFTAGRVEGEYVAVKSIENDYEWRRGRICLSLHQLTGVKYLVELIDYGEQVRAKPGHLHTLPEDLITSLPPQAMLLQLYGILPRSLEVDYIKDKMIPVISDQWTPQAEKLVNDTLKSCHQVFFIEKRPNPFGSSIETKYGDLLLCVNGEAQSLVNLSDFLCSKCFAIRDEAEFLKRQKQYHSITLDLPEICEVQSAPEICEVRSAPEIHEVQSAPEIHEVRSADHFTSSSSHQAVASARNIDLRNNSLKKKCSIEDYLAKKEAKKMASSLSTSLQNLQENPSARASNTSMNDSSASEDNNVQRDRSLLSDSSASEDSKTPRNPLTTMLILLKKNPASPLGSEGNCDASASECGSVGMGSTMQSSAVQMESKAKPQAPQRGRKPVSDEPKIKFIPAGTLQEQLKGSSHRGSKNSKAYSSLFENIPSNRIVRKQSGAPPSDSDLSDAGTSNSNHSWNVNHTGLEKHGEAISSDTSIPRNDGALPLTREAGDATDQQLTVTPPPAISHSRVATVHNFTHRNLSVIGINEKTNPKQFLEKNVLFHGGLPPSPWMNVNDVKSKFSQHIETILNKRKWSFDIFTLEKYMWPAILSRQNVVMVSGPKSGKTSSYLIPILDSVLDIQAPKGNGPLVLILCGGCKAVQEIYEECVKLINGSKSKVRIKSAYGLVQDEDFLVQMINGCEILVTTPCCLLRIFGGKDIYTNLRRLNHLVLDQAEILFTKFLPQMKIVDAQVVSEQRQRTLEDDPIQIVVSSEKWVPHLLHFTRHLRSNPIVCINDYLEAVVYGKACVKLHTVHTDKKPSYLIDLLQNHVKLGLMKTLVICNTEEEVIDLEKFLHNACLDSLVMKPTDSALYVDTCIQSWNSSIAGQHYVMLCTDHEFSHHPVLDVMCLIHYSLPQDKLLFVNRLAAVMYNLRNMFDDGENHVPPVIHIFAQANNVEQFPLIVHVMQRVQEKVDNGIQQFTQKATKLKEEKKEGKPLCAHVKMFGDCWDKTSCPNRHVLVPNLDSPDNLPNCGDVTMKILAVHNACHFSVRILEHTNVKGITRKWPSDYMRIAVQMSKYFSAEDNKRTAPDVKIGDICAIETTTNLFQRVLVLETQVNNNQTPGRVKIQFLDEGRVEFASKFMLYFVPDVLKSIPAQATDLFVCRLLPCDNDDSWNEIANSCVRQWIKTTESDLENSKVFKGQIVFSLRGALWVDPLNIMKLLPHTQTYVSVRNIRRSLLEGQHALENPGHLQKLYALCAAHDCFILPPIEKNILSRPRAQPKPMWAFLERGHFSAVEFSSADSVKCFYVRRVKFDPLLQKLLRDIGNALEKSRNKEIPVVEPGSICLARHTDGRWHRARVISVEDDSVGVFYVDYGDRDDLEHQKITTIPDWAITQLPFQAIECSLAGISSCDSVDLLYNITDDGAKCLQAKVCEKITPAECTGGSHYVVTIIDCSSASPSVLNNDLLAHDGVKPFEDQFEHIRLDLEECCKTFEKSEDETSDYSSDLENDLPVSNDYNNAVPDRSIRNANGQSSDTDDTCPDNEDEFVIGGCKMNINEIDWEAFEDFILESPFSEPFKNLVKGITHKRTLSALPETEAERPTIHFTDQNSSDCAITQERSCNGQGEQPGQQPHHAVIPLLCSARPPRVKWYEDLYHVWIKIYITGVTRFFLRWSACRIQFSTSVNGGNYHFDELLRGTICPQDLFSSTTGFIVQIKLKKACSGVFWRELFASKRKNAWVGVDHDGRIESSDDSETEVHPSIESFNRGVKKLPIRQRRQRRRLKDGPALPEESENDSDSGGDADLIDPDLMF